eukprot:3838708-Pyramimonas_sp.AAC.1
MLLQIEHTLSFETGQTSVAARSSQIGHFTNDGDEAAAALAMALSRRSGSTTFLRTMTHGLSTCTVRLIKRLTHSSPRCDTRKLYLQYPQRHVAKLENGVSIPND